MIIIERMLEMKSKSESYRLLSECAWKDTAHWKDLQKQHGFIKIILNQNKSNYVIDCYKQVSVIEKELKNCDERRDSKND